MTFDLLLYYYFYFHIQAFDLLDMLKKEEEILLAVKERKAKVS